MKNGHALGSRQKNFEKLLQKPTWRVKKHRCLTKSLNQDPLCFEWSRGLFTEVANTPRFFLGSFILLIIVSEGALPVQRQKCGHFASWVLHNFSAAGAWTEKAQAVDVFKLGLRQLLSGSQMTHDKYIQTEEQAQAEASPPRLAPVVVLVLVAVAAVVADVSCFWSCCWWRCWWWRFCWWSWFWWHCSCCDGTAAGASAAVVLVMVLVR